MKTQLVARALWPEHKTLLWPLVTLISLGLLTVYTSTMTFTASPYSYIIKQFFFAISGLFIYGCTYYIGLKGWLSRLPYPWLVCIFLLFLPKTILGLTVNGARRWIRIFSLSFQPSEFVKLIWIVVLCRFVINAHLDVQKNFFASRSLWLKLGVLIVLLLLQPDFGTAFLLSTLTLTMLFVARVRLDFYFAMILTFVAAVIAAIIIAPYRMRRFAAFLDPWMFAQDQGYQLIQSLIAIGSGSFTGQGLGLGLQKHYALPEAHTDFIFSVIVEETGFLGGFSVICFFSWIVCVLLQRASFLVKKEAYFDCYFYIAAAILLFLQSMINLGVCLGMLPTKGLTLPFFSYGGSSLWMIIALIGLIDGIWKKKH